MSSLGLDCGVTDPSHTTFPSVVSLAVTLKLERVFLSGTLRHDLAIMCQFLGRCSQPPVGLRPACRPHSRPTQCHFRARRLPQDSQRPGDRPGPLGPDPQNAPGGPPCSTSSPG